MTCETCGGKATVFRPVKITSEVIKARVMIDMGDGGVLWDEKDRTIYHKSGGLDACHDCARQAEEEYQCKTSPSE